MHYNKLSEILRAKNTEKVVKSCGREESMFPVYEEKKKNLHIHLRTSAHASPHLHNSIEFIYITEGTLELGMGQELFHMEEGDFAVIFPDVIHHYQVFSPGENRAVYLWAKPALTGQFADIIQNSCPDRFTGILSMQCSVFGPTGKKRMTSWWWSRLMCRSFWQEAFPVFT